MLVLTRKIGQQITLPKQGITINIVEVGRTQVRLGIAAPADVVIHRREVWDRLSHPGGGASRTNRCEETAISAATGS